MNYCPNSDPPQISTIKTNLVRDYGVSAHWLLTGEGQPLTEDQAAR